MNAKQLDDKATRWLALAAFNLGLLDHDTYDAILDDPSIADECSEWHAFLVDGAS